jgi:maltooligosyltrehalose trehalohydrolase
MEVHVGLAGGFTGMTERLPALRELGVTVVELMPIADFPGGRNWGYDGVLPYAPDSAYGSPESLKTLIDTAHGLGMMVLLDVVYNHFGPDGNYLHLYAPQFFRADKPTPWGPSIDFGRTEVQDFFIENALYWINEFRFDGLRLDAVDMISPDCFLPVLAERIRAGVGENRHVHLIIEHGGNKASLLDGPYDAQWGDDLHHCLHVLLTGETDGYYQDYQDAAGLLARCLAEGFAYQGERSPRHDRERGEPSAHLRMSAFVGYLQNHDQIGNRGFGERLTNLAAAPALRAATALLLLSPIIPLLFDGEECGASSPFYYFTSFPTSDLGVPNLATQVREGRLREFAGFTRFRDPASRSAIPDPNDLATYAASKVQQDEPNGMKIRAFYRELLSLRQTHVTSRIPTFRSTGARALGKTGVRAGWQAADGAHLTLSANFGEVPLDIDLHPAISSTRVTLFESARGAAEAILSGTLPPQTTVAFLEERPA